MRLTSKVIEDVISEVAGPDVVPLVAELRKKANLSEFTLAEKIGCEINQTRNMLYRLYDHNLVNFIRKKDKKKGWYIYYWTFNDNRAKDLVETLKRRRLEMLKERLDREKNTQFYFSKESGIRLSFEKAHDFNFRCPETGELLEIEDNAQVIDKIEKEIAQLEADLKEIEEAKREARKKAFQEAAKKAKKAAKKTTKKKATKKKTVKKAKKKATKKAAKKTTKKKATKKKPAKAAKKTTKKAAKKKAKK